MSIIALSLTCLFSTLIQCLIVAIVIALIVWLLDYLALGIPAVIRKLIIALGVVICVYLIIMCLANGHSVYAP